MQYGGTFGGRVKIVGGFEWCDVRFGFRADLRAGTVKAARGRRTPYRAGRLAGSAVVGKGFWRRDDNRIGRPAAAYGMGASQRPYR